MKVNNEMKIGILVTLVVTMLLVLTFKVGNFRFVKKGYIVKVQFHNIDGVELNAPVRLNGLEVGAVQGIRFIYDRDTKMELTLWLDEKAKIRPGVKAYVKNRGLIGEKYVGLSDLAQDGEFLPPDSLIIGEEPVDLEQLMAKGETIAKNLEEISNNIKERLRINSQAIDEIMANMNVSMKNITSISGNVKERLDVNKNTIDDMLVNLNGASKNIEELSADLKANPWKLLYKEKSGKK